jgi:putative acetyltransferase
VTAWELPYAYPGGLLTAGVHAVLAAGEWQLHAWDLAAAVGVDHRPEASLIRATWVGLGRKVATDDDPWEALLHATGRRKAAGSALVVDLDDPRADDVAQLLGTHLGFSRSNTPAGYNFALDRDQLADPTVSFFSAREDGRLVGIGALKELDTEHVELKSMHTSAEARGRGVARALLHHLITVATERGYRRMSLETGTSEAYAPARHLYEEAGFRPCPAFGDYRPSPHNTFMTRRLGVDPPALARS